jgi:hypothetical protein
METPNSHASPPSLWDRPPSWSITYCWPKDLKLLLPMFLRSTLCKKDGKSHCYFTVAENRRLSDCRTLQRTVLYMGEINDQQQAAWRMTLEVFDEDEQEYRTLSLFPDDRDVPADVLDSIQVKLSGLELRRP